jgi:hypothetical protein
MSVDAAERLERSAGPDLVTLIRWMDQMSTAIARVEATLERLERSERLGHVIPAATNVAPESAEAEAIPEDAATNVAPATPDKAAILHKLRTLQAEGFSHQAMADRFNTEGVPTLSGRGRWQKGTIGKLLASREAAP